MATFLRTVLRLSALMVALVGLAVALRPVDSAPGVAAGSSAGELGLEFVSHYGGTTNTVALVGDYLLVGKGPKVVVVDRTDPAAPAEVNYLILEGGVSDIAIAGDYAYVAGGGGLTILDVNQPASPLVVGSYETAASAVAVQGDYAYLAAGGAGLHAIDITNPAAPVAADVFETTGWDVRVDGNYAYVSDWWGLTIVSIIDPMNLSEAGQYQNSNMQALDVDNHYLYAASYPDLVQVFDVSDPANWIETGSYQSPYQNGFHGILVDGNYAYLLNGSCEEPGCYAGALAVLDVSNPNEPAEVGLVEIGEEPKQLVVAGDYAYIAAGWEGLQVIDMNPLATPTLVGSFGRYLTANTMEIAPDHHLYVVVNQPISQYTNSAGVEVINGRDPLNLQPASFIGTYYSVKDLDIEGNYAFLVENGRHDGSLDVYDISNPAEPQGVSGWIPAEPFPPLPMYGVAVGDGHAYVSTVSIYKLDVSDSGQLAEVDAYTPSYYPEDLVVHDNVGYAWGWGNSSAGLTILSLDPLEQIGFLAIHVDTVHITGRYAYVVGAGGLRILDVVNPALPVELGFYDLPGDYNIHDVVVIGTYAYLAENAGLRVLDLADPSQPVELGLYPTGGATRDVAFDGNYLYVLDAYSGLFVYELTGLTHQFNLPMVLAKP